MQNRNIARIGSAALVAALLGFSGTGLAQQNAVHALDNQTSTPSTHDGAGHGQSMADALAADLDAFNRQDNVNRGPSTHMPQNHERQQVAQQIRELSADVDAYNANATRGRLPETHVPASQVAHAADHHRANELADRVTQFNRSGGDLSSVKNLN